VDPIELHDIVFHKELELSGKVTRITGNIFTVKFPMNHQGFLTVECFEEDLQLMPIEISPAEVSLICSR